MNARYAEIKLLIFLTVSSLITALLFVVVGDLRFIATRSHFALFTSASGIKVGDDVKLAGVPVGDVKTVRFAEDELVEVGFTVDRDVRLQQNSTAAIKYKNLIGDRYLEVTPAFDGSGPLAENMPIPAAQTKPALDIDSLVNGFRPLLQGLDPEQANRLSGSLIAVLNGQQHQIATLVRQIGELSATLADRDAVVGAAIDNLGVVLRTVRERGDDFGNLIVDLQQLVTGLAEDRYTLTAALERIDAGSEEVAGLVRDNRPAIAGDIVALRDLASNLNADNETLSLLLTKLPATYAVVNRASSYGSFVNFFVCGLAIRYPTPDGGYDDTSMFTVPAERCR
ncbi:MULTISPECIES: MCE family protein [Nocardia]|uniref:MCE family protein n=1 Tax=Nocardia TaxID=1817 RepID=UPI0007E92D86|nr:MULTISPECIES: MCE family protein [Nocardia]MBF6278420.1 MCE family protein [Nocardia nova]OBA50504.1 mammalian cell entry protein [Nocardia sp. 852002-51101_SCH5132738]OBB45398.1 mammalian cell entry protein [Nocardia sp. 852002-51244_SCH5132740]OBF69660.1 mammalian cell entry protein [Mycobacterium sp. 852002-51759_SCH5129042]